MALESNRTCSRAALIAQLREALRDSPARTAYLFGSWSRGTADAISDVDIAVIADSDRPFLERFRDFPGLFELSFPIELLVYRPQEFARMRRQGNGFIAEIVRTGTKIL